MALPSHKALAEIKQKTDLTIALAGNPNVGKSVIFNQLTGVGVVTANYPGKTVELNIATTKLGSLNLGIIDLPGTYALGALSEDQWVAREGILDAKPDAIIVILDATNLERNLYLLLQLLELNIPLVAALNLIDLAKKHGLIINHRKLAKTLGVPVIPTVAIHGEGLEKLIKTAAKVGQKKAHLRPFKVTYGQDIEKGIDALKKAIHNHLKETPKGISRRALAMLLLEGDEEFTKLTKEVPGGENIIKEVENKAKQIRETHGEEVELRIARERHGVAGTIASEVKTVVEEKVPLSEKLYNYTISPFTGIPLLILVVISALLFLFYVGTFLSNIFDKAWVAFVSPYLRGAVFYVLGKGFLAKTLLWGLDAGIQAALSIAIPFVLTFYIILAFLEDSGYLNSMAFLTDTLMHKIGLHGRAIIPMVAGFGCNVPAVMGTRVLTTTRERTIASFLIVLVPCSARTAVIMGGVARFAGLGYAFGIFAISLLLIGLVGFALNKIMPGESSGLVMEMFPLRMPSLAMVFKKTWFRFKDFVLVAFPIVFFGSILLGALFESGLIWQLTVPLKPIVEWWLKLPSVTGLVLVIAVLRKELALQLLLTFAIARYGHSAKNLLSFMTPAQLFTYGLVNTIYIPCAATFAVLSRELGLRRAIMIAVSTVVIALLLGGIAIRVLYLFGLH